MSRIKAILAIGAAVATMVTMSAPVMAQDFGQEFSERRISSGAANPTTTIRNTGDNANLCPTVQQVSNTGNVANEQGVVQYETKTDDIDFSGSELTVTPSETAECTQTLSQAAAAK